MHWLKHLLKKNKREIIFVEIPSIHLKPVNRDYVEFHNWMCWECLECGKITKIKKVK